MILRLYIHTTGKVTGITKGSTNEVNYLGAMRKEMEEQIDGLVEKIMADFKR